MSGSEAIDESEPALMVARFYERVRADAALGPIFESAISDWPAPLATYTDSSPSVTLTTGLCRGNPLAAHRMQAAPIAGSLQRALFYRPGPALSARSCPLGRPPDG